MTTTVPLNTLVEGAGINARRTPAPIDGLARSIANHGLLIPLLVRPTSNHTSYVVIAGNRRLAALQKLVKDKHAGFAANMPVPVSVREEVDGQALELSLVENVDRADLHPVDVFEVFHELVQSGVTVDDLAARRGMKVKEVRQALSLGRMAPEVREAWRLGKISAETAEAFTITQDHKAQARVLAKLKRNLSAWAVRRELGGDLNIGRMLQIVGRSAYEAAGHQVNPTLFGDNDYDKETVSDIGALNRMLQDKLQAHCETLMKEGWAWAYTKDDAPKDISSWRRIDKPKYAKAEMEKLGCVVGFGYDDKLSVTRGIVKPGEKVSVPKTPAQKKAATKKREERQEETGGISNTLAYRLSKQLTAAARETLTTVGNDDGICLAIAALACTTGALDLRVGNDAETWEARDKNDFVKYFDLARSQGTLSARIDLLMRWLSPAINFTRNDGGSLQELLHPKGKDADRAPRAIVGLLDESDYAKAIRKHFDAEDYFKSVSLALIVDAVTEALGKEHGTSVAKMKKGAAVKFAIANVKGWVPPALRIGSHKDMPR